MARRLLYTLIVLLVHCQGWCDATPTGSKLRFRHFTTDNGVPSDCIRDIVQDENGFMWFATDEGVVRYDGYKFKPYPLEKLEGEESGNYPAALYSSGESLWVGTDAYLYSYDADNDRFERVKLAYNGSSDCSTNISHVTGDKAGNLWLSVHGKGVMRVQPSDEGRLMVTLYPLPNTNNIIGEVFVDSRNDVWAVSRFGSGGIYKLDKSKNVFRKFVLRDKVANEYVPYAMTMTEDAKHDLWLGGWDGQLVQFDPFSGLISAHVNTQKANHIHSILSRNDGKLVVGSDEGLHIYDPNSGQMNTYKQNELDAASLSDQFVHPLYIDAEDGLWIGTFYGGINYLPPRLKEFESHKASQYVNSVNGKVISAFAEDSRGNIYIASDDGGLSRYDIATGRFTEIALSGKGRDNLHALMIDGDELWVGSYTDGVYRYDIGTGRATKIATEKDNSSYAMKRDARGRLWVATDRWLNLYNRHSGRLEVVRELNAQIIDIEDDSDGLLWISTQGDGLYRYNPDNNDWRNYRNNKAQGRLPHNHVYAVAVDERGQVWVATAGGLGKFDPQNEVFEKDMRVADMGHVTGIEADQSALWLASAAGLIKYVPDRSVDVFTRMDGLISTQFMPNATLKASNGRIYVGTRDGYTSFLPYQIRPNEIVAPVVITGVEVDNVSQTPDAERLTKSLVDGGKVRLLPGDHGITINFATLSYVNPERNQYRYRLDGFDDAWIEAGSDNKVNYTNLSAGKYTFRVVGSNGDNIWSDQEAVLHIDVLSPWYLRWPMKVLYALLIAAGIFFIVYIYVRESEKKHKEELVKINAAKELDVYQAKMSFFTMVAHEIRTPVSLIIGPLEKLMRDTDSMPREQVADLTIIERNSQRLLFLVNQLLDFKKVEESGVRAEFRPCCVPQLLRGVIDRFRPSLEQNGIALSVVCDVDDGFMADIDAEQVTKLVSNLMNNARKFTRDKVTLAVKRCAGGDRFGISVTDNGPGLSKNHQSKIFRPFYQVHSKENEAKGGTGLGLSIVRSVVESHGGRIYVTSELGKGSTFTAELPVHQRNVSPVSEDAPEHDTRDAAVKHDESAQRATMLIVDDNVELCTFIADSFKTDYEVLTAHDGAEALEVLARQNVELIVSDWMMPRKDGVELCREIRADKNISHIPFVLLTAKTDKMSKVEGFNCGADAYVEKPFSIQVLQAQISNLLKVRRMLREKYSQKPLEPIQTVAMTPVDSNFLTELTKIIEENFSNPELDVDLLVERMGMSRSGLYAKIRQLVDVTPNDLIRITRLKNAARLLSSGKYRVSEVCYMVGYSSSSYFTKCFQKQFGVSPSEFVSSESEG